MGNDDDDLSFFELEDEMEMEEMLSKLTLKLEGLTGRDKSMRIGKNQFELNDKDPIFYLQGPNRKEVRTGKCESCRDFIFESTSQMHFCQFCANNNCESCLKKERMYPRGRINAEG